MTSDLATQTPREACPAPRSELRSDDSLRRLVALAARALDMAEAGVSLRMGSGSPQLITSGGDDRTRDDLVSGLDSLVMARRRPLAVPDLADQPRQTSPAAGVLAGAYLGVPLVNSDNLVTGVLHVLDPEPRPGVDRHSDLLSAFGQAISDHLEPGVETDPVDPDVEEVADLAEAIRTGQIEPWYQPIVDLSNGKVVALEALARRRYSDGRIGAPAAFILIAERSDLIVDLDATVAGTALNDLRRWQRRFPALKMSINLSGRHLDQDGWLAGLTELVQTSGVSPATVQLEITETARPADPVSAGAQLQAARSLGHPVWLDDFGSGWSGLRDLLYLPVDGIKLDQSFAEALGSAVGDVLIRSLATTATALGLKVTIEGIETPEQATLARELGCACGQGFLWSPPVPSSGVDSLLLD